MFQLYEAGQELRQEAGTLRALCSQPNPGRYAEFAMGDGKKGNG